MEMMGVKKEELLNEVTQGVLLHIWNVLKRPI